MSRWDPGDKRQILQAIADDPRRPAHERDAASRELVTNQPEPRSPHRLGRNANLAQSQADIDGDIENYYRNLGDDRLDSQARREIERSLSKSTQEILDAFFSELAAIHTHTETEIPLLIDLHRRTQSHFVRSKTLQAIYAIASYSPSEAAKQQAQEFLGQLNTQENQ